MDTKFTSRSQVALSTAIKDAAERGNSQVEPAHLLAALLEGDDSIAGALITHLGGRPQEIRSRAQAIVAGLPSASGSSVSQPQLSRAGLSVISSAEKEMQALGDSVRVDRTPPSGYRR